jgi:hypothetical protein
VEQAGDLARRRVLSKAFAPRGEGAPPKDAAWVSRRGKNDLPLHAGLGHRIDLVDVVRDKRSPYARLVSMGCLLYALKGASLW